MVAGDVDHPGTFAHLAEQLLDDVVVGLRPIPTTLEAPTVDDVADEIDRLRVVMLEEIEDELVLATPRPKMQVGHEEGAIAGRALRHSDPRRFCVDARLRRLPSPSVSNCLVSRRKVIRRIPLSV